MGRKKKGKKNHNMVWPIRHPSTHVQAHFVILSSSHPPLSLSLSRSLSSIFPSTSERRDEYHTHTCSLMLGRDDLTTFNTCTWASNWELKEGNRVSKWACNWMLLYFVSPAVVPYDLGLSCCNWSNFLLVTHQLPRRWLSTQLCECT